MINPFLAEIDCHPFPLLLAFSPSVDMLFSVFVNFQQFRDGFASGLTTTFLPFKNFIKNSDSIINIGTFDKNVHFFLNFFLK
jgi:hypothetical protein